ncbi:MAG: hypothetical protein KF767_09990 [Bdellovibrionaceae bacterium]|nr:hypothetical protein [Pseudobdellovibrionaceae bacterium]
MKSRFVNSRETQLPRGFQGDQKFVFEKQDASELTNPWWGSLPKLRASEHRKAHKNSVISRFV